MPCDVASQGMEDIAGIAVVAALALYRLRQMMRWVPGEARVLGIAKPFLGGVAYSGQALPIAFLLPDGREIRTALRNYTRRRLPEVGERMSIRYDPGDPERAEWAVTVPVLALILVGLLAALAVLVWRSLGAAGVTA